jgi:hypothetical protein
MNSFSPLMRGTAELQTSKVSSHGRRMMMMRIRPQSTFGIGMGKAASVSSIGGGWGFGSWGYSIIPTCYSLIISK